MIDVVGSFEPFIRGLYNVAPKCVDCGEIAQFIVERDGKEVYLCTKCVKKYRECRYNGVD